MLVAFSPLAIFSVLIALEVPLCPSKNLFGIPCPGCGLTRATEALVVGDVWTMLQMHPLAPILTPVALFSVVRATMVSAGLVQNSSVDPLGKIPNFVWVTFGVVLIGLWIARLAGFFGGHPDDLDFSQGWIAQTFTLLWNLLPGS